jgi:hypothetical protein
MEEPVETAEPSPEVMPENPNEQLQQTIGDALAGTAAGKNLSDSDFAEILSAIVKSLSVEAPVEGHGADEEFETSMGADNSSMTDEAIK